jgi:hypothetical protein
LWQVRRDHGVERQRDLLVSETPKFAASSVEGLGRGAYLVTLLPSVVTVLTAFAFFASDLYPWASPVTDNGKPIRPGFDAVLHTAHGLGGLGLTLAGIAALCLSVLLRPFQIAFVQLLEGYWEGVAFLSVPSALLIERHARRMARGRALDEAHDLGNDDATLTAVAEYARWQAGHQRGLTLGRRLLARYPQRIDRLMPTVLGNVLRRGETLAGERYGLATVETYPRLYPFLSEPVRTIIASQLDLLDTTAAFVVVLFFDVGLSTPLLWRWDRWSWLPLGFIVLAWLANLGAVRAARRYTLSLHTAFDLHRFQMLAGLRRKVPLNAEEELAQNEQLTNFFVDESAGYLKAKGTSWEYNHQPAAESDPSSGAKP